MLGNNTKYSIINHCTPDKVIVAENAHVPRIKTLAARYGHVTTMWGRMKGRN